MESACLVIGRSLPYECTESLDFSVRANRCLSPLVSKNQDADGENAQLQASKQQFINSSHNHGYICVLRTVYEFNYPAVN